MKIKFRIATESDWLTMFGDAPDGSDQECYALSKENGEAASRAEFWSKKTGLQIPETRGMVWTVIDNAKMINKS